MLDLTNALGPKVAAYNKQHPNSPIKLLAKAEFQNPASFSHKDRIARAIITKAEERGELTDANGNKKTSKLILDDQLAYFSLINLTWALLPFS